MQQHHPIIVLDGPDGTGKSTLAKEIAARLKQSAGDVAILHQSVRWKENIFMYHTAVLELALKLSNKKPVILDRWWMSHLVYQSHYKNAKLFPMAGRLLDRVALKHRFVYVVCLPRDKDRVVSEHARLKGERTEMYESGIDAVWDGFNDIYLKMQDRIDICRYDRFESPIEEMKAEAALIAKSAQYRTTHRHPDITCDISQRDIAGNFNKPKIMLVGDKSNPKTRRKIWPFFEHTNSSLWLTEALEKVGISEYDCCWINAYDENDWPQTAKLQMAYTLAEFPTVVPLGGRALAAVESALGLKCGLALHHPSYSKRFSPDNIEGYRHLAKMINR